ncbi:MAG: ATP-binding protein [Candidatus Kapabacteria bacterium]|nr:ATP-binding protein [Candidatus Kapabacteria bacterium]
MTGPKIYILILYFLLFFLPCSVFSNISDDLSDSLRNTSDPKNKVVLYEQLFDYYLNVSPKLAPAYIDSIFLINDNDFDNIALANKLKGDYYFSLSDFSQSLEFYLKSLDIYEKHKNLKFIATLYNCIGQVYHYQGKDLFAKAVDYYNKALSIFEMSKYSTGKAESYRLLSEIYADEIGVEFRNIDKANEFGLYAMDLIYNIDNDIEVADIYTTYSWVLFLKNDLNKALSLQLKALRIYESYEHLTGVANAYINIGAYFSHQNKSSEAIKYYQAAIEKATKLENIDLLNNIYESLSEIFYQINDYKSAYDNYKLSVNAKFQIYNKSRLNKITEIEKKYEAQKKDLENQKLRKEKETEGFIIIFISVLTLISIGFVISFYIRHNTIKQKNALIEKQHNEIKNLYNNLISSETKYETIFNNSYLGIYRTTPDGQILIANPAMIKILNYPSFEHLSELNLEVDKPFRNYSRKLFKDQLEKNGRIIGLEGEWVAYDGSSIYVRESVMLVQANNGEPLYYDGFVEDISEKRKVELELLDSQKQLKDLNDTKDKFFSIISHDLKNPLAALITGSNFITRFYDQLDDNELLENIKTFSDSAKYLFKLLENLLEWSRSQTGAIEFKPKQYDLVQLINANIYLLRLNAKEKNITLKANTPDSIYCTFDENMITTVIRNLTSNAIKFTPNGGQVTIQTEMTELNLIVKITDTGIGISSENISKLFRLDQSFKTLGSNNESGTGLGLIISNEFVEKHNGKIWAESQLGVGSTFCFSLPIKV